ncbi:tRNA (N6-threonylcarbamoyladenosine(37)-N6)-methyltransferase TrmO [Aeropyrum pernix]|uniref:tRNA (N6-threonylcarbamoyladenosine(37)-N6)-methyltransferase TrmO n=1 Tax=Aeropyrum pernix TaxID=56636 RepID=UPI0010371847|nr:tRNA (N6-threonylcarbamoyladenosine(37)-N6)-methyltransferase TrmO [Aeropyrum pernix]
MEIVLRPIGFVRHGLPDSTVRERIGGVEGFIEVLPEYAPGLDGLAGFSHIIVIAYLHKSKGRALRVRPRGLLRLGFRLEDLPEVGVFATDSPSRPNPLALTIARLLGIEGRRLRVSGLDLYDGTPVLDIKPYTPSRRVEDLTLPSWYKELLEEASRRDPRVREV